MHRDLISSAEFETLVEEALAKLPKRFADLLENIAVVVEEEPTEYDLEILDDEEDEDGEDGEVGTTELLGIFRGTPLTRRSFNMLPALPNTIAIFRGPILRVTRNRREALSQIRETVIHELGHYFGLDDEDMAH
ncbi:MAG TPA: metallopeptidase family protein [Thermoanaerobaculia bacterium]|nr:metallopeptidase family protein [Thermoanaerobaculia bacterium]